MDCSPPGSSVHGTSQARILEWIAISFTRRTSRPRDSAHVSCIGRRIPYLWVTREALETYWASKSCLERQIISWDLPTMQEQLLWFVKSQCSLVGWPFWLIRYSFWMASIKHTIALGLQGHPKATTWLLILCITVWTSMIKCLGAVNNLNLLKLVSTCQCICLPSSPPLGVFFGK